MSHLYQFFRPRVERLEDRSVLTTWPINLFPDYRGMLTTYGQFTETGYSFLFHEGTDFLVGPEVPGVRAVPVMSIDAGHVFNDPRSDGYNSRISVVQTGLGANHGWNYIHALPDPGPPPLAKNQELTEGQRIGTVATGAGVPRHLHVDYTDVFADPTPSYTELLRPKGDPLDYLGSLDSVPPTVSPYGFRFRLAASDSGTTDLPRNHYYFQQFDPTGLNIPYVGRLAGNQDADGNHGSGSQNIDVIANAFDTDPFWSTSQVWLTPKWVKFRIQGDGGWNAGDDTGEVTPFNFSGEFLNRAADANGPAGHNYGALRDVNLVRTVYEHDVQARSRQNENYFFILTNYNGNNRVEYSATDLANDDRSRSWQSDVLRPDLTAKRWYNALNSTDRATYNARSAFRDGFYELTVTAGDAAGNESLPASTRLLLANFARSVGTQLQPRNPPTGYDAVVTSATNFRADVDVPIYLVRSPVAEGTALVNRVGVFHTDANGNFSGSVNLGDPPPTGFTYVADYDDDRVYYSPLDVVFLAPLVETGPAGLADLDPAALLAAAGLDPRLAPDSAPEIGAPTAPELSSDGDLGAGLREPDPAWFSVGGYAATYRPIMAQTGPIGDTAAMQPDASAATGDIVYAAQFASPIVLLGT